VPVVSDAGSAFYVTAQSLFTIKKSRHISPGAQAEMGFTIPASIGVSFATDKNKVVGITGDGSFQFNIQELQTIRHHNLPIKLFVWNNNGYLSIRTTQNKFFAGRNIGTDCSCGVSFPDLKSIAKAYNIKYYKIKKTSKLQKYIKRTLDYDGPVICEIFGQPNQILAPIVSPTQDTNGKLIPCPLEDMTPLLDRDEFNREMIVKQIKE